MDSDVVAPPPHLASDQRRLYRGVWLSEIRETIALNGIRPVMAALAALA